ncbi:PAS domain S-box protein, partial [bacterium]|nr:PAS domain S-box protein [bacterium]
TAGRDLSTLMIDICNDPLRYEANINENMRKDGQKVWIAWTNKPILDENQQLKEVLSIGVDITELRRTTEALRESTQMMQLVFDTIPARVFWKNKELVFMGCSRLFAIDAGLESPAGIVGKTDYDLPWRDTEAEKYRADDQVVMETGVSKLGFEETQYTAEGRTTWIITSKVPLKDVDGNIIGVLGTYEDITERKLAVENLRKSEERFRNLFDRAADALYLSARDGRFIGVNQTACNSLGYSRDELLGLTVQDILVGDTLEEMAERWRILLEGGALTIEGANMRKDGTTFPVESRLSLFDYGDQILLLAVVRDITERKQAEEAIERRGRQLEVLSDTSRRLNAVLEVPAIMRELVRSALELCYAESGTSGLLINNKMVFSEYNYGDRVMPIDYEFPPGYGAPGCVMETRKPYISNDAKNDPQIVPEIQQRFGFYNLANVPIISRSGDLLGCFEIHNTKDGRSFDETDVTMLEGLAASAAVALENAQMFTERQRAEEERRAHEQRVEEQMRQFYRDTIFSVTGGRLDICDQSELMPYLEHAESVSEVHTAAQVSDARHEVERFLRYHQLDGDRLDDFMVGVGEAITNAIKHGYEGIVYAGEKNGNLWVGIEDHGTGIDSLVLPRAVLLRGYSTKPSLGLGYSVMLEVADQIHLKTDKHGTTVILEKSVHEHSIELSLQNLPDTWNNIMG